MNVVKICGGIGNQMFQYAFGKVLELQGKDVAYNLEWYEKKNVINGEHPRPFRLDRFEIPPLRKHPFARGNPMIEERNIGYNPGVFEMKNENNYDGWWQYYGYYAHILPVLQKEFQLKTSEYTDKFMKLAEKILDTESVSVHVRRGDYQLHRKGVWRDLPAQYYFSAIREVEGELFFFSDDIPWCKETFKREYFSKKLTFVDIEDYLAFELMKLCKHNITTNSTFSWWAALLNENPDKKVYRPTHYPGVNEEDSDLYRFPKEWIKIEDYAVLFL